MNPNPTSLSLNRRQFMGKAAAAGAAFAIVSPHQVRGAQANGKIRLGVIGCGGRGAWIGSLFQNHGGYEVTALAEYFTDRLDAAGEKLKIDSARRYSGLSGYKRMLDADVVDAVAIISPPYFHPEHAAAAVDAGKHVYLAKPVAVDVPGLRNVEQSAKKATAGKLAFLVDFQTRANPFYIEAIRRVHAGALGEFTFGRACYIASRLGQKGDPAGPEGRLRNWVFDIALSGDILVEQNIHSLDVMSWAMGEPPVEVVGGCGRKSRTDVGDCNDHFALYYRYADCAGITFTSKQYKDGAENQGIVCDIFGSRGRLVTKYGGNVSIYSTDKEHFYRGGRTNRIYIEGPQANIATLHDQITSAKIDNNTIAPTVQSHLVAMMGRQAAYSGQTVTWKQIKASTEKYEVKLDGLKD